MDRNFLEPLEPDRTAFDAKLPELLAAHKGKFALFKDGAFVDVYDAMDSAYVAGLSKFGLERFYIAHVTDKPLPEQLPALMAGVIRAYL